MSVDSIDRMLNEEQQQALRTRLQADRARILDNAREALGFTMDRDRDRVGRDSLDESTEEELYSTAMRFADRENRLLAKIDDALERLEAGTIDECEECEEPIGYKRLLARPVTTLCIDCKELRESTED
jgi:DnaK suppressor protein